MDGTILKRGDFPSPEVMGGPTVVALRPAVHGALLEAAGGGHGHARLRSDRVLVGGGPSHAADHGRGHRRR